MRFYIKYAWCIDNLPAMSHRLSNRVFENMTSWWVYYYLLNIWFPCTLYTNFIVCKFYLISFVVAKIARMLVASSGQYPTTKDQTRWTPYIYFHLSRYSLHMIGKRLLPMIQFKNWHCSIISILFFNYTTLFTYLISRPYWQVTL